MSQGKNRRASGARIETKARVRKWPCICPICDGRQQIRGVVCPFCHGTGMVILRKAGGGSGPPAGIASPLRVGVPEEAGLGLEWFNIRNCPGCGGKGYVYEPVPGRCLRCNGTGMLIEAKTTRGEVIEWT